MKKSVVFTFVAMLAVMWSCQMEEFDNFESLSQNDEIVMKSQPVPGNYGTIFIANYADGKTTLTFEIDQSGAQDISHMLFQFIDCYGNNLSIANVLSATVNGAVWTVVATTGGGTGCEFENDFPFIKLDDFNFDGGVVTVVIVLDEKVDSVDYLIKSGQGCFPFSEETDLCVATPVCQTETAFGGVTAGSGRAWWFYYKASEGVQTIWAGQHIDVGTVEVVDGVVNITLTGGWELQDVSESVKIKGYSSIPTSRPSAGQFRGVGTYKGKNFTNIPIGVYDFYVIHLDVQLCK